MPTATAKDLKDHGFSNKNLFGAPADFDVYLNAVLGDAEARVRDRYGSSNYDAVSADSVEEMRIKQAEKYFAVAELWRRRAAYSQSNAMEARGEQDTDALKVFRDQADSAEKTAQEWLQRLLNAGGDGVASFGHIETGHLEEASS